jgi:D-arabinose 1-dehydrogenase-like Zn-dependent alcohol dehydrogenase
MRAAVLHEVGGKFTIEELPDPKAGAGQVVVAIESCSICNTDWHAHRGDWPVEFPQILGHQVGGVVAELGEGVTKFAEGDRVVVNFALACYHCWFCQHGMFECCDNWRVLGLNYQGGMAERIAVTQTAVDKIPDAMTFDEAGLLSCGMGTAYRCFKDADVKPGETVLILGGILWGLTSIQLAHAAGAQVIVTDTDERRLEQARKFGADHTIANPYEELIDGVMPLTHGRGVDKVLEYSADPDLMGTALVALRKGGRMAMVAQATMMDTMKVMLEKLIFAECTLKGSFLARQSDLVDCIELYEAGKLDLAPLIDHRLPLEQLDEGMRLMNESTPTCVAIHPSGSTEAR